VCLLVIVQNNNNNFNHNKNINPHNRNSLHVICESQSDAGNNMATGTVTK